MCRIKRVLMLKQLVKFSFLFVAVFEDYQKQRLQFVQRIAEYANDSEKIETLQNAGKKYSLNAMLLSSCYSNLR